MPRTASLSPDAAVEQLVVLYESRGRRSYDGTVDQVEHGVQAAVLAQRDGAPPALVVAALLHDVGHLLEGAADDEGDRFHERLGARFLVSWFPPAVVGPVALHVEAKRYLVATDASYMARLSKGSRRSLALQGGPFSPAEAEHFEFSPHAQAAIRLRRWDEAAKVAGIMVPSLRSFAELVRGQMRPASVGR